jgi:hypothetical protein
MRRMATKGLHDTSTGTGIQSDDHRNGPDQRSHCHLDARAGEAGPRPAGT